MENENECSVLNDNNINDNTEKEDAPIITRNVLGSLL